jgi:hypothetical protein
LLGNSTPFKTTQENFEERKAGMRLKDMPQTFQDVISIACAFNIRYLWMPCEFIPSDRDPDATVSGGICRQKRRCLSQGWRYFADTFRYFADVCYFAYNSLINLISGHVSKYLANTLAHLKVPLRDQWLFLYYK